MSVRFYPDFFSNKFINKDPPGGDIQIGVAFMVLRIEDIFRKRDPFDFGSPIRTKLSNRNLVVLNFLQHEVLGCWKSKSSKNLHKIFFNKVVAKVIEKHTSLNFITRGWYLYGVEIISQQLMQGSHKPKIEEVSSATNLHVDEIKDIKESVVEIAKEFNPQKDHYYWESKQYSEFKNLLYDSKLKFQISLKDKRFPEAKKNLTSIRYALKRDYDGEHFVEDFLEFTKYLKLIIMSEDTESKIDKIWELFCDIWKLFSTESLIRTVEGDSANTIKSTFSGKIHKLSENSKRALVEIRKLYSKSAVLKLPNNKEGKFVKEMVYGFR